MRLHQKVIVRCYLKQLRNDLYATWVEMMRDLQARMHGKPYVFKWPPPPGYTFDQVLDCLEEMCRAEGEQGEKGNAQEPLQSV